MKKSLFTIVFYLSINIVFAQDLICTVSGEYNGIKMALDSIIVENLTNNTKLLFGNLLVQKNYRLNLTKNTYTYPVGINEVEKASAFVVAANSPGMLTLNYIANSPVDIRFSVYTISGQCVYISELKGVNIRNSIRVKLRNSGVFFVRVETPSFAQTFKAIGVGNVSDYTIEIVDQINACVTTKSGKYTNDTDICFSSGDTIKISIYRYGYIALPAIQIVDSLRFVDFLFEKNYSAVVDSFIDYRDDIIYKTVKIGEQIWMAENLAYLPSVSSISIISATEPYYYVNSYGYDGTSVSAAKATDDYGTYGALYNWPAAKIACPEGWHLPSDSEWKQMEMAIGMSQSEADDVGWRGTNEGMNLKALSGWAKHGNGTDYYGFSSLPGGIGPIGNLCFFANGIAGSWWSATDVGASRARYRHLRYNRTNIYRHYENKEYGLSVRCIKN